MIASKSGKNFGNLDHKMDFEKGQLIFKGTEQLFLTILLFPFSSDYYLCINAH